VKRPKSSPSPAACSKKSLLRLGTRSRCCVELGEPCRAARKAASAVPSSLSLHHSRVLCLTQGPSQHAARSLRHRQASRSTRGPVSHLKAGHPMHNQLSLWCWLSICGADSLTGMAYNCRSTITVRHKPLESSVLSLSGTRERLPEIERSNAQRGCCPEPRVSTAPASSPCWRGRPALPRVRRGARPPSPRHPIGGAVPTPELLLQLGCVLRANFQK